MSLPTMPPALAQDWRQLHDLIDEVAVRRPIPCRESQVLHPDAWTSENAEDLAEAAAQCWRCPAVDACRTFGLTHLGEVGVLGGLTPNERRRTVREREAS
ncbi:WhiB family transcriptional regulator [Demequina sp.]|uniref:WhiB family transcriptional regulator n=1 Tax=Demequina sp. TaxID=2050685 RepID=UPI003A841DE2